MRLERGMSGFSLGTKQMVLYRIVIPLVTVSTFPDTLQSPSGLILIVGVLVTWQTIESIH